VAEGEDDTREHNGRLASWSAKEPTFSFGEEQVGAVEKKLTLSYAYHTHDIAITNQRPKAP